MLEEKKQNLDEKIKEKEMDEKKKCDCGCEDDCDCGCEDSCDCGCAEDTIEKAKEDAKDKLLSEYLDIARRVQADFDNYRKRTLDDVKNARQDGVAFALSKMFPFIDSIEKSLLMVKDEKALEGLNMVWKALSESLKSLGVEKIETKGKKFDPKISSVIATLNDSTKEDEIVLEEATAGYKIGDKVIRFSQVVVNKIEK